MWRERVYKQEQENRKHGSATNILKYKQHPNILTCAVMPLTGRRGGGVEEGGRQRGDVANG
jgi:hypothetical protein